MSTQPQPNRLITVDHEPFPFFFVGCWNKGSAAQTHTFDKMRTAATELHPTALLLGGDNIYPDKINAEKVYSKSKLAKGYADAAQLNVPLYVALGNHNVATQNIFAAEQALPWTLPANYYCIRFAPDPTTQICVLDTNLYDSPHQQHHRQEQEDWLESILSSSPHTNTIIVQHEPLIGIKEKKGKRTASLPNAINLYRIFATYKPTAVLSAHIHNYQDLTLSNPPVHQLIVGTGGADLNALPASISNVQLDGIDVNSLYYGNGFLNVTGIAASGLQYKFIPA